MANNRVTDLEMYSKDLETRMKEHHTDKPFNIGIQCDYGETTSFIRTFLQHQGYEVIDLNLLFLNSVYSLKIRSEESFTILLDKMVLDAQELVNENPDAKPALFVSNLDLVSNHYWTPLIDKARDGVFIQNAQGEKQSIPLMIFTDYQLNNLEEYLHNNNTYYMYGSFAQYNTFLEAKHHDMIDQMKVWRKEVKEHLPDDEAAIVQFYLNDVAQRKAKAKEEKEKEKETAISIELVKSSSLSL